jgi:hypothetical protein
VMVHAKGDGELCRRRQMFGRSLKKTEGAR